MLIKYKEYRKIKYNDMVRDKIDLESEFTS